jgi:hypothetical protein
MPRAQALRARLPQLQPPKIDQITLNGGLDEVTPPFELKPGQCRQMQNFEQSIFGGYRRSNGYERCDGRPKPSDAAYAVLQATITGIVAAGNVLTGATSGATGVVAAFTATYFVLTKLSAAKFQVGENLTIGGVQVAASTSLAVIDGASTPLLAAQYLNFAADQYRADIAAVPGSGKVLGIWLYNDVWYAFRNNAGGTAAVMFKQTPAGWAAVPLGFEVAFSAGTGALTIVDGGTLTQGGVTATISRVVVRAGSLVAGSAVGTLVLSAPVGGNFAAGAAAVGAGTLTLAGIQSAITLNPSGRFEFVNWNFSGAAGTKKMYGADGRNPAFEFDGTVFAPIHTGMAVDTPLFIMAHKNQLFLSFLGSVQHSGPGTPFIWSAILGAAELAMGDTVTGFSEEPGFTGGGALAIFCRARIKVLYGSGVSDWQLTDYRENIGAVAYTAQTMAQSVFLDDRGVTNLVTVQRYGNFYHGVLTNAVRKTLVERRTTACASCVSFDLSQYRVFFTSGYAYFITMIGEKIVGIGQILYPNAVRCIATGRKSDGSEEIMFGSDNGFVFQMERGTSFDGEQIEAYFNLAYNFQKAPRNKKHYRRLALEVTASTYTEFNVGYSLGYGNAEISQALDQLKTMDFSPVRWDAFTWDAFFWDGTELLPKTADLGGSAENISLVIRSVCDYCANFTVTAAMIHFEMRRALR